LVVGCGGSGCQIAEELYQSGRTVYLSVGRHRRIPRRYRGRDMLWWLEATRRFDTTVDSLPGGKLPPGMMITGAGGGHTVDLLQAGAAARRYGLAAVPKRPKAIAIEFAVADVGTCRAVLTKGGVPAWTNGERTAVAANRANGVVVMMAPEGSPLL